MVQKIQLETGKLQLEIEKQVESYTKQFGGFKNDSKHIAPLWISFIQKQLHNVQTKPIQFRDRMIKIAALTVMAVNCYDQGGTCSHVAVPNKKPPPVRKRAKKQKERRSNRQTKQSTRSKQTST